MIRSYSRKVIYQEPADRDEFLATVGKHSLLPSVSFDREVIQFFDVAKDPSERHDLYTPERAKEPEWRMLLDAVKAHRGAEHSHTRPIVEHLDHETASDLKALGYIQ